MLQWLKHYRRALLPGDISAGMVVAMMMIPQGMAYALVAGLPPVAGIYASILPPVAYALFGSSMTQSVGPMAIVALMTAAVIGPLAPAGSALAGVLAAQLAMVSGAVLLLCGLLRMGFLANFFSRPVMSGFTVGSALVIAFDQLHTLLGAAPPGMHTPSALLGVGALLLLVLAKYQLAPLLRRCGVPAGAAEIGVKLAPMLVVLGGIALMAGTGLAELGVRTTGAVPAGLPRLNLAISSAHWPALLQPGLLIGFIIFLMSMSAAQSLALKRNEKLVGNHELVGLGAANVASALSGGFPVTGSLSRSAVNFAAGANTPLASLITAALLACAAAAAGVGGDHHRGRAWHARARHPAHRLALRSRRRAGLGRDLPGRAGAGRGSRRGGRGGAVDGHLDLARQPAAHRGARAHRRQRAFPQYRALSGRNPARAAGAAHRRQLILR
jgi:SulP family sulfate permease